MAGPARWQTVCTFERVGCAVVVEHNAVPLLLAVAGCATIVCIIGLCYISFMHIGMAIVALLSKLFELPLFFAEVTFKTGRGLMSPPQRKCRLLMLFDGVGRSCKTIHRVAIAALSRLSCFHQLALVIVGMAVGARAVFQRLCIAVLVAGSTGHQLMPPFERIVGELMIEGTLVVELPERLLRMALAAILSKLVIVHILVAVNTIVKLQPIELLEFFSIAQNHFMTGFAVGFAVLTPQAEFGFVVTKARGRPEGIKIVALAAVIWQALLVIIFMTAQALGAQPQEAALVFGELGIGNVFFLMAVAAVRFGMRPLERVLCEAVIELLFIKSYKLKIAAMMVIMTFHTAFGLYLVGGMVALVLQNPLIQGFMAVETLLVRNLLPKRVTQGAVRQSFEMGMRGTQIAGRKLRPQALMPAQQHQQRKANPDPTIYSLFLHL